MQQHVDIVFLVVSENREESDVAGPKVYKLVENKVLGPDSKILRESCWHEASPLGNRESPKVVKRDGG